MLCYVFTYVCLFLVIFASKKKLLKKFVNRLESLPRIYKQLIMILLDVFILSFSLWLAFVLKVGDRDSIEYLLWPKEYILKFWSGFILIQLIQA